MSGSGDVRERMQRQIAATRQYLCDVGSTSAQSPGQLRLTNAALHEHLAQALGDGGAEQRSFSPVGERRETTYSLRLSVRTSFLAAHGVLTYKLTAPTAIAPLSIRRLYLSWYGGLTSSSSVN